MRKVVITGIGVVTPLGNDIKTTWENLTKELSGISCITRFNAEASNLPSRIAGELKNFSPEDFIPRKDILRLDPFIHYATAAAMMAAQDAGIISFHLSLPGLAPRSGAGITHHLSLDSAGVVIGSSRGGIMSMEKAMEKHLSGGKPFSAYLMSSSTINMASSYISMRLGIKGPAIGISTACASGTTAIGEAARLIRCGEIDLALAGGAEAPICRLALGGYGAAGALSKRNDEPEKASRPFDKGRDGFVIAEGAGILMLEEFEHALKRGAKIYAEIAGYGTSSDAFHQTRPDSSGEAVAIEKALKDADVFPEEVNYINAHATSTVFGDITETQAIKKVFKQRVFNVSVSSCKSMLGHMLGGAGGVEAAITAMAINKGTIIPTSNLENPDPHCDLNHVTSTTSMDINVAISNSFGFGGINAVLVFRKTISS